jgi:hypothetical protein
MYKLAVYVFVGLLKDYSSNDNGGKHYTSNSKHAAAGKFINILDVIWDHYFGSSKYDSTVHAQQYNIATS